MATTEADPLKGFKDVDLAQVFRLEQSNLNCYPSLMTHYDRQWMMRFAPGNPARRVNSLNFFDKSDDDLVAERLVAARSLSGQVGVPFVVRWTPLMPEALDRHLEEEQWTRYDPTLVLERGIWAASDPELPRDYSIERFSQEAWTSHYISVGGTDPSKITAPAVKAMSETLARITSEKLCLTVLDPAGEACAVLLAVLDRDCMGLFAVATHPEQRRKGFARALLVEAQRIGALSGCHRAWLQVVAENTAAVGLYESIGYREAYRYHYCKQ
ncbi:MULTISPECIES: GNAT family N-acetyltransferase [Pseudovibrio]|uniref:GNAT family N-acetyltransferase n=1 Tax=Stappiaceae TaxID=2821832 RepID=UPI002366556C|nr:MULTISPECIES: GNAT family N-acetyltransferase [Pseudovibrio]MDD7909307.1 GNAT family N-acetyltransferase [Pseudovibrio exalbescens]MDX5594867.1 GNAT family N-acetyltransferase [Pseudovibrio sp. SPO723]